MTKTNRVKDPAVALFFGIGLAASALASLMAGAALGATACPAGSEPVTVDGKTFCQPTTPLTFEANKSDRGSDRLDKEKKPDPRSEFPERSPLQ